MVGDGDHLRFVLHDEHGVALVAQLEQQAVHPLDVVRVQPGGGLVEDVGDIGQARVEVPDHLHPLGLAAGERAGLPVQAQVAQADLHQRVQRRPQALQDRLDGGVADLPDELGQVADLHRRAVGDAEPFDLRRARRLVQACAVAVGAVDELDRPVGERPRLALHRLAVLAQVLPADLGDQSFVGEVVGAELDLDRWLVQEVLPLGRRVVAQLDVRVEPVRHDDLPGPGVDAVAGRPDRALVERQVAVDQLVDVDVGDHAEPLAGRAHALRGVEAEGVGRADVRDADPAEHDPQHRVGVGGGAHGRAGVGAHPLLVDDDRRAQVAQRVHVGPVEARHEALDERRVGLVDQPPGLGGDGVEDEGGLAGAGDPGEDGEPPLGDVEGDAGEIVLPGATDLDEVVAVRGEVRGQV